MPISKLRWRQSYPGRTCSVDGCYVWGLGNHHYSRGRDFEVLLFKGFWTFRCLCLWLPLADSAGLLMLLYDHRDV